MERHCSSDEHCSPPPQVLIGRVPDRGGRIAEMKLSARDLMPSWQVNAGGESGDLVPPWRVRHETGRGKGEEMRAYCKEHVVSPPPITQARKGAKAGAAAPAAASSAAATVGTGAEVAYDESHAARGKAILAGEPWRMGEGRRGDRGGPLAGAVLLEEAPPRHPSPPPSSEARLLEGEAGAGADDIEALEASEAAEAAAAAAGWSAGSSGGGGGGGGAGKWRGGARKGGGFRGRGGGGGRGGGRGGGGAGSH